MAKTQIKQAAWPMLFYLSVSVYTYHQAEMIEDFGWRLPFEMYYKQWNYFEPIIQKYGGGR